MDNDIVDQVEDAETERFRVILEDIKEGRDLRNEEAVFLAQIIGTIDGNLTVAASLLESLSAYIPQVFAAYGNDVARRCGRTDAKLRKAVLKIGEKHAAALWEQVRLQALSLSQQFSTTEEETE
jgi:hypothetical protein